MAIFVIDTGNFTRPRIEDKPHVLFGDLDRFCIALQAVTLLHYQWSAALSEPIEQLQNG
jgi:hypothetical protein